MRLVSAEFLKLYKRTGIVLAALGLTVVPSLIMMVVTGDGDFDKGGMRSFADQFGVVAMLSLVSGILVGATVGTADVTSGVFRDLVVTGRSRLDLYAARVPAGLLLVLVAAAAGFAIVVATAFLSAGSRPASFDGFGTVAPETGVLVKGGLWLALTTAVGFALAFGVASVVGSPGGSIASSARALAHRDPAGPELRRRRLAVRLARDLGPRPRDAGRDDRRRPCYADVARRRHRGPGRVDDHPVAGRRVADDDPRCLA